MWFYLAGSWVVVFETSFFRIVQLIFYSRSFIVPRCFLLELSWCEIPMKPGAGWYEVSGFTNWTVLSAFRWCWFMIFGRIISLASLWMQRSGFNSMCSVELLETYVVLIYLKCSFEFLFSSESTWHTMYGLGKPRRVNVNYRQFSWVFAVVPNGSCCFWWRRTISPHCFCWNGTG